MAENGESITLGPKQHGSLGGVHCGVTRPGLIVVAGEQKTIEDGQTVDMNRARVRVARKGDDYVFTRA